MNYFQQSSTETTYATGQAQAVLIRSVFTWMTLGLLVTAFVSAIVISSFISILTPGLVITLSILEIGLVFWLSARINKMSATQGATLFLAYSAMNGITLSPLALIYTGSSLTTTFFTAASMFAAVAFYGNVTKKDLSSWNSFLMMGLFGIIIAMVVNIFFASSAVSFVISILGVVLFCGLTAYDVNRIRQLGYGVSENSDDFKRVSIIGALGLYLNFINLFIQLLHLMGERRN